MLRKRCIILLLVLVLVFGLLPGTVWADEYRYGDFLYRRIRYQVTITGYTGDAAEVVIPAEIEGVPVTSIGGDAFENCSGLTSIVLPEGVTSIGSRAFAECSSLTSIVLPDSLTSIGSASFSDCTSLYNIDIPDGVIYIEDWTFFCCSGLTSIMLPDSTTYIGERAFGGCNSLASIDIPDSVNYIGFSAFSKCNSLTSIELPDSLTYISSSALNYCTNLTDIYVNSENQKYTSIDGVLFNKDLSELIAYPGGKVGSYAIPVGVSCIGDSAFRGCTGLARVDIYFGVTSIGDWAFSDCSSLTSIELPDSLTSIGRGTFSNCQNLTHIELSAGLTSIGDDAFSNCSNLSSIKIPSGVASISEYTFSGCSSLTSIDIPSSVTYIGNMSFFDCNKLSEITFMGNAPTIEDSAFPGVIAVAHYPAENPTWHIAVMQDYGGDITWVAYHLDNTHKYTTVVTAPTCTEEGYTTHICVCGDSYISDKTAPLGHSAGEPVRENVVEATCTEDGSYDEVTSCAVCGEELSRHHVVLDALGHVWQGAGCDRCGEHRSNPFTDVPADSFYFDAVLWAVEKGITNGATTTTFNPNGTCLRAQVVTFLHRAAGNPEPTSNKNPFTDVKPDDFFYQPVLWAVDKGITNGISATTFGSYANCNRAAVVTFLWRAAGEPEPESTNNPFVDVKATDFFYKPVLWAVEQGITNGVDATHFGPATDCNRAQVVTFLYRANN